MRERPILFSSPMVRALLAGTKTQTRRVMKLQPDATWARDEDTGLHYALKMPASANGLPWWNIGGIGGGKECPYGQPGDRLWVRETWNYDPPDEVFGKNPDRVIFRADYQHPDTLNADEYPTWKPSIFMPRWASRILLEITGVRVKRLQDISIGDCCAEGAPIADNEPHQTHAVHTWYQKLWESINGHGSWAANPWVWVVEFKVVKQ